MSPQRRRIYRRRRIVASLIGVVVLAMVVFCVYSLGRAVTSIGSLIPHHDSVAVARGAVPTPKKTSGVRDCGANDVSVHLSAKSQSVALAGSLEFVVSIEHRGSDSCLIDASNASRVLTITSGSDTVWRSNVCPSDPRMLLMAGNDNDVQSLVWNTNRTGDACVADADLPRVDRGTYTAKLSLANDQDVVSESVPIVVE